MTPRHRTALALTAATLAVTLPASAQADVAPSVLAPPNAATVGYATPVMGVPHGGELTLANLDLVRHTIFSDARNAAGDPLFQAGASPGETTNVAGVSSLAPGTYAFHCELHPHMRGTLVVAQS